MHKFDKRPLGEALKKLADDTPWSLVLDARVGDKAKLEITTTLKSVPLDTAVRILADMADLQPVIMDNVIYVTTRRTPSTRGRSPKTPARRGSAAEKAQGRKEVTSVPRLARLGAGRQVVF